MFVAILIGANYSLARERGEREHKKYYEEEEYNNYYEDSYESDDEYEYYDEYIPPVVQQEQKQIAEEPQIPEVVQQEVQIPQVVVKKEILKDSDGDGVLDKYDIHPGEDDFIYMIKDENKNGIADDLEPLLP